MIKNAWERILASSPVDANARSVVAKGYAYAPTKTIVDMEWDECPPLRSLEHDKANSASFVDLTGVVFGRFRVVGMALDKGSASGKKPALWVCRCSCGRYAGRRAKAIKAAAPDNRCQLCQHAAYLQRSTSAEQVRWRNAQFKVATNG